MMKYRFLIRLRPEDLGLAHIPDGVLSAPLLITGAVASSALLAAALRRLELDQIPRAAVLSAAFFVCSLISIPLGPASVHLLLNGLMGLLLGWAALPALLIALVLQAAFFGHGGILALGVNTLNLALPALACALALRPLLAVGGSAFWVGAAAGAAGVLLAALLTALSLALSGEPFVPAAQVLLFAYAPLALVEGLISGTVVRFLKRVDPQLLRLDEAVGA
jgi:cobalt/nickel transport system permease protein